MMSANRKLLWNQRWKNFTK